MKTNDGRLVVLNLKKIPRDVRDHFRSVCIKRGITMAESVVSYMRSLIKDEAKKARGG